MTSNIYYEIKMPNELKIHDFLIGNKNYNSIEIVYLIICILIVSEIIPTLRKEYLRSEKAVYLKDIDLQQYIKMNKYLVRKSLSIY
jgi:hypothetical protein